MEHQNWQKKAREMVKSQILYRGISCRQVMSAMETLPRHKFMPEALRSQAWEDYPLPIGWDQTISQPYIVALMTELLDLKGTEKVLEIGTGSGYQTAVLARLAKRVYSIEVVDALARQAAETLAELGLKNLRLRHGDGYEGWPESAPFDAIIVTAAPPSVPLALLNQLAINGRMVIPVGNRSQQLKVIRKTPHGFTTENIIPVKFVPMVRKKT